MQLDQQYVESRLVELYDIENIPAPIPTSLSASRQASVPAPSSTWGAELAC